MPEETFQERTEPATPRRREEARQKGQVARSLELNSFAVLFVGALFLYFAGAHLFGGLARVLQDGLKDTTTAYGAVDFIAALRKFSIHGLIILGPVFAAVVATGILVGAGQVGFQVTPEALRPRFEKLNPANGLKRVFSRRSLVELVRDILKLGLIGTVAWLAVRVEAERLFALADMDVGAIAVFIGGSLFRVAIKLILSLLIVALLDYAYQRWDFERSIRMSKYEVKEEMKLYEGSPLMRSRIRQVQRELARMRMAREIPKADVVITNPTELAVALKYDTETMSAPTVVAKGARLLAQKIREIARGADVPIVENPPLARALYSSVEIGAQIPAELYRAVAEVLAYVYRIGTSKQSKAGPHTVPGGEPA